MIVVLVVFVTVTFVEFIRKIKNSNPRGSQCGDVDDERRFDGCGATVRPTTIV